ncbi:MAG: FliM/FliN family flagellar motor switch protein [Pseudomonadota bacterium]
MTDTQADAVEDEIIAASGGGPARLSYLELLAGAFAEELGADLSTYLRANVSAGFGGIEYRSGEEMHGELGDAMVRLTAELPPWPGKIVLAFERSVMLAMVNALLGQNTIEPVNDERPFTRLETRLVRQIAERVLTRFAAHLAAVRTLSVSSLEIDEVDEEAPPWASAERCFTLKSEFSLLDCTGAMTLILPEDNLADDHDLIAIVPEAAGGLDSEWRSELSDLLRQADVTLTAVLAETKITLADAMQWQPGKAIALGIDTSRELDVLCEGRPAFRAVAGHRDNGAIALRLTTEVKLER